MSPRRRWRRQRSVPRAAADGLADETVGAIAELYLGNILYSLEMTALALQDQGRAQDAAFYRGIARKLAEAHGRASKSG